MSNQNLVLIQQSWNALRAVGDEAGELFLYHLVHKEPTLRPLIPGSMDVCSRQLLLTVSTLVENLDHFDRLVPMLREHGQRHAAQGIGNAHYRSARESLLLTLDWCLGDAYTPAVEEAWLLAWQVLTRVALRAAGEAQVSSLEPCEAAA